MIFKNSFTNSVIWLVALFCLSAFSAPHLPENSQSKLPESNTGKHYFPMIATAAYQLPCKRGLARAALSAGWHDDTWEVLGLCWFHDWNTEMTVPDSYGKIPSLPCNYNRIRTLPNIPYDYENPLLPKAIRDLGNSYNGYLMLFNEPNEPYTQCGFGNLEIRSDSELAHDAAQMFVEVRESFPYAKIIVGNIVATSLESLEWFDYFANEVELLTGAKPDVVGYGLHPYSVDPQTTIAITQAACDKFEGFEIWVTEWGIDQHDPMAEDKVRQVRVWLESEPCVTAHAYYTNAQPWLVDGIALFWETDLYSADEYTNLSPTGLGLTR